MRLWDTWRLYFEPRDLWIGAYWNHEHGMLDLYICPVPCLVLHLWWMER